MTGKSSPPLLRVESPKATSGKGHEPSSSKPRANSCANKDTNTRLLKRWPNAQE